MPRGRGSPRRCSAGSRPGSCRGRGTRTWRRSRCREPPAARRRRARPATMASWLRIVLDFSCQNSCSLHPEQTPVKPATHALPGLLLTNRMFELPLDYAKPACKIEVFVREVVAPGKEKLDLPYVVFFQGGP